MANENSKRDQFADLLRELFQLNQPELDFGIYRIMHARKDDINRFIERDLPRIVGEAFKDFQSQDKVALQAELEKASKAAADAGFDPEQSPKVRELKAQLNGALNLGREEGEVYDALITFFNRYYDEGDFVSRRVYKDGTYAIPYNGEEVVLHWANKDQYYIKSSETLRDYSFRLDPSNEQNPIRVHFRLVDAEAGAQNNNKESAESKRVFVLDAAQPWEEIDGEQGKELSLRFHYRAATPADWTTSAKKGATASAAKKPPTQDHLRQIAVERLLDEESDLPVQWKQRLAPPYTKANGEQADYTILQGQLDKYTKSNTFDYFIHKDLGGFLNRELDFYIKNELLRWEDVAALKNQPARLAPLLSKIEVIRTIGEKIIAFLAQLEEFQKKLWLKKKFVTEVNYCITLDRLEGHEELLEQVFANEAQRQQWKDLYALDLKKMDKDYEKLSWKELLAKPEYQFLVVDTGLLDASLKSRIMAQLGDLDRDTNGVLLHSENFQALGLVTEKYLGKANGVYIDPPYNTGSDGFAYKDKFMHSSWLALMADRARLALKMLSGNGVFLTSINDIEFPVLSFFLGAEQSNLEKVGTLVWKGATDNNPTRIAVEHEYLSCYVKDKKESDGHWSTADNEIKQLILDTHAKLKKETSSFEELSSRFAEFVTENRERLGDLYRYRRLDENGPYVARRNMENPGKHGYDYDVIHPITKKPCRKPYWGWRFPEETMKEFLSSGRIIFGDSEDKIPELKVYLEEVRFPLRSVFSLDARKGSNNLDRLFGSREIFKNPKPVELLDKLLPYITASNDVVLDYFAGSGTTAHAVLNINREDGGNRKYLLVEMGDHFDRVILPRIKKVVYSKEWKDGKPMSDSMGNFCGVSHCIKYLRLESYEDALSNLSLSRGPAQQSLLDSQSQEDQTAREAYLLNYMLDVETRGSDSLLNVRKFVEPTNYKLKVRNPTGDETKWVNVDLLETFNWLLGLTVEYIAAPVHFDAELKQAEYGRWQANVKRRDEGRWWFRTVTGTNRSGQKILIVWRNLPSLIAGEADGLVKDNAVLDAVLIDKLKVRLTESADDEFDILYVNGDHNITIPKKRNGELLEARVKLIEEDFHRLMFSTESH